MSSRIFLSVPCSTVTISHCQAQDATIPARYRQPISEMARSSGAQSGFVSPHHRQDVRVDEGLEEQRGSGLRGGADQDADHDGDDAPLVLEDVAEDALDGVRFGFAHAGFCGS